MDKILTTEIKKELESKGHYDFCYKASGYYCYVLLFVKDDDGYTVTDHLSCECGLEEDLDFLSSSNFDEIISFADSIMKGVN